MITLPILSLYTIVGIASAALRSRPDTRELFTTDDSVFASVELFERADFDGFGVKVPIHEANTCYNVDCFDEKASSARWKLPADAYLGFYEDQNCRGTKNHWFNIYDKRANVTDLSKNGDLDNVVSSIIVLKFGAGPLRYVRKCGDDLQVAGL